MLSVREALNEAIKESAELKTFDFGQITQTGTTYSVVVDRKYQVLTWHQVNDAVNTAPSVVLEGSLDGSNWFALDESNSIGGELRSVSGKIVKYFRVNIQSLGDATFVGVVVVIA